jgi:hypothetical protein
LSAEDLRALESHFVGRGASIPNESNEIEYCMRIIERLREENALLRSSAMTFGALAERLNAALRRERGITAPDDDVAGDALR